MKQSEADYLLGRLNGRLDEIKEAVKEEIQQIRECLKPLKEEVAGNSKSIVRIKAIGGTISAIFSLILAGLKMWLGRHHQ